MKSPLLLLVLLLTLTLVDGRSFTPKSALRTIPRGGAYVPTNNPDLLASTSSTSSSKSVSVTKAVSSLKGGAQSSTDEYTHGEILFSFRDVCVRRFDVCGLSG